MSVRRIPGNRGLLPNPKETYDLNSSAVIVEHLVIWNPNIGFWYQKIVQSWFTSIPSWRCSLHQHVCVDQCKARWLIISPLTGLHPSLPPDSISFSSCLFFFSFSYPYLTSKNRQAPQQAHSGQWQLFVCLPSSSHLQVERKKPIMNACGQDVGNQVDKCDIPSRQMTNATYEPTSKHTYIHGFMHT